ncbi:ABC transporter ATP-binding protein [Paenibacillus thermotolerans]|uniref:ABC transporter ATP-binding protein n=1 Tax=Paenibacillus thermotolerans TaxID=3027807 RepID=UPI0023681578|nr:MULTISPECIES: ABC transporter ATP-binding protein [unclassified Paenibacillus]
MAHANVLEIKNVTKKIGNKTIVDNLSFEVPRGEVFGFLGPNGAGKTTTIRMIVGLMKMTEGDVFIEGKSVTQDFVKAMGHVGAIVEFPELYKFLSGYRNLVHFARMHPGVTKERIREVIRLVGLEARIHDKVKTYSLGMRQRLGVAQALLHKPSLLILDEPTNGLDPAGIRELRDYLRRLAREEGISVLVSSHLLSEMELMCDSVAIILGGKLMEVKKLKEFLPNAAVANTVAFAVDQPSRAIEVLRDKLPGLHFALTSDGFTAAAERSQVPFINSALVGAGLFVYEIKYVSKTLEDAFLEMTGGEKGA